MSRFSDINDFLPMWDPRFKGKKAERVSLEPTEDSWIVGHFISSREATIESNTYTIHKFKVLECGNHEHLSEDLEPGKEYEVFGTSVLNSMLADPTKVKPGDSIMVKWIGKVEPKTKTGRNKPYDSWKVFQDNDTPALLVKDGIVIVDGGSSHHDVDAGAEVPNSGTSNVPKSEPAPTSAEVSVEEDGDDDLPF
ncbi:hypothetical protein DRO61_03285 [Candidatus Bathyarchaeota archaeon]|jgi:hypothetical protein|nr:MAG: hypothetical protein DRO61_03285 [Candidatus Bathyarchaeota archaeon]